MYKLENNMLGLDRVFNEVMSSVAEKYPFYDIRKEDGVMYIDLAVAGFTEEELEVYVDTDLLVIKGDKATQSVVPYFKSISSRSFKKSFALGGDLEISEVTLKYGILTIKLVENIKTPRVKSFKIN
jgi:molecular chaperone IbpA